MIYRTLINLWDRTSFYLNNIVYYLGFGAAASFIISEFVPVFSVIATMLLLAIIIAIVIDALLLYRNSGLSAKRLLPDRLSNGDENKVMIQITNRNPFQVSCFLIDELPYQLHPSNFKKHFVVNSQSTESIEYSVTPTTRGEYHFGKINIYVKGPLKLVSRRYRAGEEKTVKVYPSYVQMRRFSLIASSAAIQQTGVKRVRKLGHSMEFEQIKEYVRGDDYRTINWKATARRGDLMSNSYTDERSQQIYCILNKGRLMKMPFGGMTLLDYAINASLVISNIALQKQDKAGLITFSKNIDAFLAADKKPTQINLILETLYKQDTLFEEPDFQKLFSIVRNRITHRSLIILFTNFESVESLQRDLPSLKRLAHYHLVMVVFFENTELKILIQSKATTTEDIYIKAIAEKYMYEKQLIAKELQKHGMLTVLTTPQALSVNTLNKYLEIKNKQSI